MDQALKYLPGESLPYGAPEPELTKTQYLEIYGLGTLRAVVVVEPKNDKNVIKTSWLSAQDATLARLFMNAIRERFVIPGKGLLFHVDASQPAIMEEVKGYPLRAQIMSKHVEDNIKLPEDISYRDMTKAEAHDYFAEVEETYVKEMLTMKSENEREEDVRERSLAMIRKVCAPDGADTIGHRFIKVEHDGMVVSTLWIGERSGTQSFCYNVEVNPDKRRLGYGRKVLLVWELAAAEQGLVTLGLNVFGSNTAALKLYTGGGFRVDDATFILDDRKQGI